MLQQFIRQAVGEYEDRLEERGIRLRLQMVSEPVRLYVDGARLWRIFENLLGNMIKYGRQDSTADLTVTSEQQAALISMTNLSQEKITSSASDLMERFGRGDQSRRSEGFGLGLSIAQSLTELMGGAFSIEVEEERFTVVMSFPA